MNNLLITSNKTTLKSGGYTHVNLPIFSDSNQTSTVACMDDIDIGKINKFGFSYLGYDPTNYEIRTWSDFVTKLNGMLDYLYSNINPEPPVIVEPTGISINEGKNTISLTVGNDGNLIATVTPDNATNRNVSWTIDNSTYASISPTTTSSGQPITITPKAAGTTIIKATAVGKSSLVATCALTVSSPPTPTVTISPTSGTLSSTNPSISISASVQNMSSPTYTWTISGSGATLSATSGQTVNVNYGSPSSSSTVTVKCTAKSGSTSVTSNTATITCESPVTKYKYAKAYFTYEEVFGDFTTYKKLVNERLSKAWESSNTYWTTRPDKITIPDKSSGIYTFTLIYDARLGQGKFTRLNGNPNNLEQGKLGEQYITSDEYLGMELSYSNWIDKYDLNEVGITWT